MAGGLVKVMGAIAITKPYQFIGFGAIAVTKPYKFIGFGAMAVTKPYKLIGFGTLVGKLAPMTFWSPTLRAEHPKVEGRGP